MAVQYPPNFIEFVKRLEYLADNNMSDIIPNDDILYAKEIIQTIFGHAKKEINIFSSRLIEDIYGTRRLISNANAFLSSGGKMNIVLQEICTESEYRDLGLHHQFIQLCNKYPENCKVRLVNSERDKATKTHFIISDDKIFRYCSDKEVPEAIASFNHPPIAKNLAKVFRKLFERSIPVSDPYHI